MKSTLQILLLLCAIFVTPMLTSILLDIKWITAEWSRSLLVYLLMLLEFVLGILMLHQLFQNRKQTRR